MEKLTEKQMKFCEEYLVDLNATQAAIRAGYSEDSAKQIAYENLTKPYLVEYLEARQKQLREKTQITQEWVVNRLKEISDRCMQAEPVLKFIGGEYVESGEFKFDSSGANKATELLGRHIGIFEKDNKQKTPEKVEITFNGDTNDLKTSE
jgi:phage terminase small subunit